METGFGESRVSATIVETEAYRGRDDKAAHSYQYRRTPRTEVFFGPAAHAYVYLCYGIHHMFNVIVGPVGEPNAVLIRAVEPREGLETMLERRGLAKVERRLSGGPGLVCQALGLDRSHNGLDLLDESSFVRLRGPLGSFSLRQAQGRLTKQVITSPRVGIAYAEECAAWPWRFRVKDNPYTSPAK